MGTFVVGFIEYDALDHILQNNTKINKKIHPKWKDSNQVVWPHYHGSQNCNAFDVKNRNFR